MSLFLEKYIGYWGDQESHRDRPSLFGLGLIDNRNLFLAVLQAGKSKISSPADSMSAEACSWLLGSSLFVVSSRGESRGQGAPWLILISADPTHDCLLHPCELSTFQNAQPPITITLELSFQHRVIGRIEHAVYSRELYKM